MSYRHDNDNTEVVFAPKEDVTLAELVELLRRTLFRNPGSAWGLYSRMPPEVQRHFVIIHPAESTE